MFLFQADEAAALRERARHQDFIFALLDRKAGYLADHPLYVPEVSAANWGMYYHCPDDSAALTFDFKNPHVHVCPKCGKAQSGEPFDSAWESVIHGDNAETALRYAYLYVLTQDTSHAAQASAILLAYAKRYPNYQIHGDIPYNGPGLTFAQTLDEAVFLRKLAYAYDLVRESMTEMEQNTVLENLFRRGAAFLLDHRTAQVHNHEVLINSAAGILGLLLEDAAVIEDALYAPFGLLEQLERGTLQDDFWFEGTISYHEYALEAFFTYEIFARYTPCSNLGNLKYLRMLKKARVFLLDDNTVPALNDSRCLGQKFHADLALEFGYAYYRDPEILDLLHIGYQDRARDSRDAFFFGAEQLPDQERLPKMNYHNAAGSGITILRGGQERFLLIKHSPFGGEHDHYDRLGISFSAFGDQMCSDLGTVPYGVKWHYDYYKNTGTHNTVMVEESNQPPQNCQVLEYRAEEDGTYLDCRVRWSGRCQMPPTFVLQQWENESYADTCFRRRILWKGAYFIDVCTVNHPQPRCTDWILHVDGRRKTSLEGTRIEDFSQRKPFCFLSEAVQLKNMPVIVQEWKTPHGSFRLFSYGEEGGIYAAKGPNLPPEKQLDYIIQRQSAKQCLFINVFEAYQDEPAVCSVQISVKDSTALVTVNGETEAFYIER